MATHSSVLAWRIPGTGEPGGLPSMGSRRVGHDCSDLAAAAAAAVWYHQTRDWKETHTSVLTDENQLAVDQHKEKHKEMKGWTVQKRLSLPFHLSPADMSITQENTFELLSPSTEKLDH